MKYTGDQELPQLTNEQFDARPSTRPFTAVVLKAGPKFEMPGPNRSSGVASIIYAHGKRNYALYLAGLLPIVCPVADGSGVCGISIFDASPQDVDQILAGDPGVQAGVFTYEIHPTRTFPGNCLPGAEADTVSAELTGPQPDKVSNSN
jgi:hypothetical protein